MTVSLDLDGGVLAVTLQGATAQNPMSKAMNLELQELCRQVTADPAIEAMVLTGGPGRSFCAGGDFNEVAAMSTDADVDAWIDRTLDLYIAMLSVDKPTIAAVDGYAIGIGFQLALTCDLRVATPAAKFIMWELKHGVACTIGAFMLQEFFGRAAMLDLILDCEPLDLELGLASRAVHSLTDPDTLIPHAHALARRLADYPELSRRRTKEAVNAKFIAGLAGIREETRTVHREAFAANTAAEHFSRILD